jgi:hypothetical protein
VAAGGRRDAIPGGISKLLGVLPSLSHGLQFLALLIGLLNGDTSPKFGELLLPL